MNDPSAMVPYWSGKMVLGPAIPQRGNILSRSIGRGLTRLGGWRVAGEAPNQPKLVVIGGPHTSTWDWPMAMSFFFGMGLYLHWLGKHTFVNGRFGPIIRWMGGIAVDRRAAHGVVGEAVAEFERRDKLWLGIAPEGTRGKTKRWKTGFYHIAVGAKVPILPVTADYSTKVLGFRPLFHPTGDIEADMPILQAYFTREMARNPDQF